MPLQRVRTTLLTSAFAALRARGHYDAYLAHLPAPARDQLVHVVAGTWVSAALAEAHYEACDKLRLDESEVLAVGAAVGDRIQATVLNTLRLLARESGVSPWTVFEHYARLWVRMFDGGSIAIDKVGPKDAHVEIGEFSLARFAYFRASFRGVNQVGLALFSPKVFIRELRARAGADRFTVTVSWV